ncbi:hypothetical protein F8M41_005841 [Gigaspora margarita]|uniref:Uncharacterized protein n=1 Tax=Gigaspora margarita TaxID=4874 RepID=A0A8H3X894_GIGMA|nr:hypothetical protein F8M41_005841 [Gigaspora margarita]
MLELGTRLSSKSSKEIFQWDTRCTAGFTVFKVTGNFQHPLTFLNGNRRFERRLGDEIQELKSKIKLQGEKIRALKSLKTDQDTEDAEIATLLDKQIHSENSKGRLSS